MPNMPIAMNTYSHWECYNIYNKEKVGQKKMTYSRYVPEHHRLRSMGLRSTLVWYR